jgi:putative hydrolase of HD superfamily
VSGSELERILAFATELTRLETVERRVYAPGLLRQESSAEHSWHVCMLALLLAGHAAEPVDLTRVLEILLVHDVPEIDVGDQIAFAARNPERDEAERAAAERLFGLLPAPAAARLLARWQEYEERATPEARFAYAVDRLAPVLFNLASNGRSWRENGVPLDRIKAVTRPIGDALPEVWALVEGAMDALDAGDPLPGRER